MTDDRPTPPAEERAHEDAELGFAPQLADDLRTAMTTAVADVHAPAALYDQVRSRERRRRWATRAGMGLAGLAAVAGVALATQAAGTSTPVVVDPVETPTGTPAEPSSPADAEPTVVDDDPTTVDDDPTTVDDDPTTVDDDPTLDDLGEGDAPTVVLDTGVTAPIPAFQLAVDAGGNIHLVERGADGREVDRRTVVSRDELVELVDHRAINQLWVRPGSTPDDLQAVLELALPFDVPEPTAEDANVVGTPVVECERPCWELVTIEITDRAGVRVVRWAVDTPLARDLVGDARFTRELVNGPHATWSPDGRTFAYAVSTVPGGTGRSQIVVADVDDDGRPTLAGTADAPEETDSLHWSGGGVDGVSLWATVGFPKPDDRPVIEYHWTRQRDGLLELTTAAVAYEPAPDPAREYLMEVVPTPNGIVEVYSTTIRATGVRLVVASGDVRATVPVPTSGFLRLSTLGRTPVLLTSRVASGPGFSPAIVIAPTDAGTLEFTELSIHPREAGHSDAAALQLLDWVD